MKSLISFMKSKAAIVIAISMILVSCNPKPAIDVVTVIAIVAAQDGGVEVPPAVITQIQQVLSGEVPTLVPVDMSTLTEDDYLISPVTGKHCMFLTKKGLTPLGVMLVNSIIGSTKRI